MDIDKLRFIKDSVKRTVDKMSEEKCSNEETISKLLIIYEKVLAMCNGNHKLTQEVMKFAVEELHRELVGDFNYMLDKINERC